MTLLNTLVRTESAKALGWTLIHSLWEGAAIALALGIVLLVARSSRVRYAAACMAMLLLLAGFAATLYRLMPREIGRPAVARALPLSAKLSLDAPVVANSGAPWDASGLLPWLAPIWLAGVVLFQLRCLVSWAAAGRLRRIGVCEAPREWLGRLDGLRERLRLARPVALLESCFAEVPVVIGHLRPVILMPVGLLAGLPPGQVEAILLHELSHIRRADYLVNLMQTLVEGLLFYHPAAWWISSAIRNERENCCDDLVVATSGDAHGYATALTALAENRWTMRAPSLAATGGNLVKRIRRLLAPPEGPRASVAAALSLGILIFAGAVALGAWEAPAPQGPGVPLVLAQAAREASSSAKYDKWLKEEVVYIITDGERADFQKLRTDAERERFIQRFWERRDPTPGTPANEFKDEHYRRIAYVNDRFKEAKLPGWKTDRGRIYIQYGPPDEIDSHPSGGKYTRPPAEGGGETTTHPFEQRRYRWIEGVGTNVVLEFVDKAGDGEFHLVTDPSEKYVPPAKAPEIKLSYKDLPAVVSTGGNMYNRLPMKVQMSYVPLTSSATLAQITVMFETKDLHFEDKENVSTATIEIHGQVATLAHRPLSPFEDIVRIMQPTDTLPKLIEADPVQIYQKTLTLQPGSYRLRVLAEDGGTKDSGRYEMLLDVPQGPAPPY